MKCTHCELDYYFQEETCKANQVQNCVAMSDDLCIECKKGYGLKTDNGVSLCVQVNKNNCITFELDGNFDCVLCHAGYYPNADGACAFATIQIPWCLYYESSSVCL